MFEWGVLKREVPESVRFCIGRLPMYTSFNADPSLEDCLKIIKMC